MKILILSGIVVLVVVCTVGYWLASDEPSAGSAQVGESELSQGKEIGDLAGNQLIGQPDVVAPTSTKDGHEVGPYDETGPQNEGDDARDQPVEKSALQNGEAEYRLDLSEIADSRFLDTSGIDQDVVSHGTQIGMDISQVRSLPVGSRVEMNLLGSKVVGTTRKNEPRPLNMTHVVVEIDGPGVDYMSVHMDENRVVSGEIYANGQSYFIEHNGSVGYLISIYEYKKLKNALLLDHIFTE